MILMHQCPHVGCTEIIPLTRPYCDKHISRHKQYDQTVRLVTDARHHAFYVSKEWKSTANLITRKYHGLCLWSYYHGEIVPSKPVHHIVPLREDWDRRLDADNLIPLSQDAHAMIEAEYKNGNKKQMQIELFELKERWEREFN